MSTSLRFKQAFISFQCERLQELSQNIFVWATGRLPLLVELVRGLILYIRLLYPCGYHCLVTMGGGQRSDLS